MFRFIGPFSYWAYKVRGQRGLWFYCCLVDWFTYCAAAAILLEWAA